MQYTNNHGISLPIAVWLLHDEYDHVKDPKYISATTLLKPTKQLILSRRVALEDRVYDVSDFLASSLGTAIHDSVEKAWTKAGPQMMKLLGYPAEICDKIVVNPDPAWLKLNPGFHPVYLEQRNTREIEGYTVGGKFDMIIDGRLFDIKSTSVWAYLFGSKDQDYALQGSIYKWLNEDKVKDDNIYIQFIFTDWKKADAKSKPDYPSTRAQEHTVKLLDGPEIERFMRSKIREIERYKDSLEEDIPECTDEELWRSAPQYRYFSDPEKAKDPGARSTKNFDDMASAKQFMAEKGSKGVIVTKPGEVKRCAYCPAFPICKQKDRYNIDV